MKLDRARCGEWMRQQRLSMGWGATELAAEVGVNPGTLTFWEQGKSAPDLVRFAAWAEALGLAPGDALQQMTSSVRREGPRPSLAFRRRCEFCRAELPASADLRRRFCNTTCRNRARDVEMPRRHDEKVVA